MYIYKSDVYIRILMYIYESSCTYTNLDVYITVLTCKFMNLMFCPFLTSIVYTEHARGDMFRQNGITCGHHCCFCLYVCYVLQKAIKLSQGDESSVKGPLTLGL